MNFSFTVIFPDERYFYYIGTKVGGMEGYILLWLLPREFHKLPFCLPFISYIYCNSPMILMISFFFLDFLNAEKEKRHAKKLPDRKRFLTIDAIFIIYMYRK